MAVCKRHDRQNQQNAIVFATIQSMRATGNPTQPKRAEAPTPRIYGLDHGE